MLSFCSLLSGLLNDVSYTPQITRKVDVKSPKEVHTGGPAPKLGSKGVREKFSSTATMFFNPKNSCSAPNVDDTLKWYSFSSHVFDHPDNIFLRISILLFIF